MSARRVGPVLLLALVVSALVAPGLDAQERPSLRFVGPDGTARVVPVSFHRGYAALPASGLEDLGWRVAARAGGWELRHPADVTVAFRAGSPFFEWDGRLLQLVGEPYAMGEGLHLPVQLVTDFFPDRLPDAYAYEGGGGSLVVRVRDDAHWSGSPKVEAGADAGAGGGVEGAGPGGEAAGEPGEAGESRESRVVVIDAGHGGRDPGATGPSGLREKDVALEIALALRRELSRYPGLEVHLTREEDVLVPIWRRGEWATEIKGERPGVFVSIHANAMEQRGARGFETYFLSEARTDHERRVAALENAPLALDDRDEQAGSDLDFILRELRNFDHAHWSALLADFVQRRISGFHPGPDRGVKQAPLAVITNALMPAVLVEAGFISNRDEERVLGSGAFHEDMARALAGAVVDFFQRYPPGEGATLEPPEPEGR